MNEYLEQPQAAVNMPAIVPDMSDLAEQLVAAAAGQGIDLTGENGLLTALTRQVLQSALEVEMAHHLGYDKHDPAGRNGQNSRNGSTPKTVTTEIGKVTLDVPRDRENTYEPQIVRKHQRRLAGFDEAVISLYAKGMTTGDITRHLSDVYDTTVSRDLVSKVTDQVLVDMRAWQSRTNLVLGEPSNAHQNPCPKPGIKCNSGILFAVGRVSLASSPATSRRRPGHGAEVCAGREIRPETQISPSEPSTVTVRRMPSRTRSPVVSTSSLSR